MGEVPVQLLCALRRLTVPARRIPGLVLALEVVRRRFVSHPGRAVVGFDHNLEIEVRLGEHMGSHLFWYGAYSRDILLLLDRLLHPGMVVVDVGANIGEIALAAGARVSPGGTVYAFEPAKHLAARLRANVARNRPLGIRVLEMALGAAPGRTILYNSTDHFTDGSRHDGITTMYAGGDRMEPVGEAAVLTLDRVLSEERVERVDLIKVDVEGAELPVLQGARESLRRFRPMLIVELQEETSRAAGYRQEDLLQFLQDLGYRFETIGRRGLLRPLTRETLQPFQNVLCTPGRDP